MKYFLLFFFIIPFCSYGQLQFSAKVDSTSMLIGDKQNLRLTLFYPAGDLVKTIFTEPIDTCSFMEIIAQTPWQKSEKDGLILNEKIYQFGIYQEGEFTIPAVYSILASGDTLSTFSIPLQVRNVEPDSTGLAPIKGIIKEANKWEDYLVWIISISALVLAYIMYKVYQQYRTKKLADSLIKPLERIIPPYEIALEKLSKLKSSKIWQQGLTKEFHSQLTYILREYLEKQFGLPALESTTNEIIQLSRKNAFPDHLLNSMRDLLNVADWVKFAKGETGEDTNDQAIDKSIDFIMQSVPLIEKQRVLTNPEITEA